MDDAVRFAGDRSIVCHWCRETVLQLSVEDKEDNELAASTSGSVPDPLCQGCFEEITKILERCVCEGAVNSGLPVLQSELQPQGGDPSKAIQETNEKKRQAETMKNLLSVETKYWQAYSSLHLHLLNVADVRDTLQRKMERTEHHLAMMNTGSGASRYDYFKIRIPTSSSSPIGVINGFRLGTTPSEPVDWWELNTAWGIAVLLLEQLRMGVFTSVSSKHRKCFWVEDVGAVSWVPRGSYPRVITPSGTHELVGPVSKILCLSYDKALVLFVKCLDAVGQGLLSSGAGRPPHEISVSGDRIGGTSVKYGLSRDLKWTSALRCVLENLDWCLDKCRMNL